MRIVIADDHAIFRQGLKILIDKQTDFTVIGEAKTGYDALALVRETSPEAVIMDISMPELSGLEATRLIKTEAPEIKVIILSMFSEDSYIEEAFRAEADGYVTKNATYDELKLALVAVSRGEPYISSTVARHILKEYIRLVRKEDTQAFLQTLTEREREIVRLISEGFTRQEIARMLSISPKTVDRHRENIREKSGA